MSVDINKINEFHQKLLNNLEKVIVGKRSVLEKVIIGLLCQGHLLIEDVPGVGKTMLARALSKSIGCEFQRIQFTPDMLPSDVTGVTIFNQVTREFEFKPGPIMAQIVLADEINRATPKTQSALLEAMEEKQVTVDGKTHYLPKPFMVMGTQNPIEYEGTFQLPEAQLDRFLLRIKLGYPSSNDEIRILENQKIFHPIEQVEPVLDTNEILVIQEMVKQVYLSDPVKKYIVEIVRSTRSNSDVYLGSSPRGSIGLFKAAQANAALQGRDFVLPDDIKYLAESVLAHRLVIDPTSRLRDISQELIISETLKTIPVPGGKLQP